MHPSTNSNSMPLFRASCLNLLCLLPSCLDCLAWHYIIINGPLIHVSRLSTFVQLKKYSKFTIIQQSIETCSELRTCMSVDILRSYTFVWNNSVFSRRSRGSFWARDLLALIASVCHWKNFCAHAPIRYFKIWTHWGDLVLRSTSTFLLWQPTADHASPSPTATAPHPASPDSLAYALAPHYFVASSKSLHCIQSFLSQSLTFVGACQNDIMLLSCLHGDMHTLQLPSLPNTNSCELCFTLIQSPENLLWLMHSTSTSNRVYSNWLTEPRTYYPRLAFFSQGWTRLHFLITWLKGPLSTCRPTNWLFGRLPVRR